MVNDNPIIKVENLKAWYEDKLILDDINFSVNPGEIFIIAGVSGGGKTTLLRCLIGLQQKTSGRAIIDGDDILSAPEEKKLDILKKIGIAYQNNALFGSMTLLENVMFPLKELSSLPDWAIRAIGESKLSMVGLSDYCDYFPAEISSGMQKRAAIARAVVFEPKVIFLDEPSAGLDPVTSEQIDDLILMLSEMFNITFVIVSHALTSIYNIGKRIAILNEGKIIATGDPRLLRRSSQIEFVKHFLMADSYDDRTQKK